MNLKDQHPLDENKILVIKGNPIIGLILISLALIPFFTPIIYFQYIGASTLPIGLIICLRALAIWSDKEDDKK